MVTCKHCSTPNSLDSTFCKRCGTALPDADVTAAQEKLTELIAKGNNAFNEGRTDEAMAVAESACASNPSSVPALSLRALCHERRGELAEALECADRIVDLNPDSELDKIKRNQLRTKLSVAAQLATQPPDRRAAVLGATAAVILFLCIGIGTAKLLNRADESKAANSLAQREPPPLVYPNQTQTQPSAPAVQQQPVQAPPQRDPAPEQQDNVPQVLSRPTAPSVLPTPSTDGGDLLVGPVDPPVQPRTSGSNSGKVAVPTPAGSSERSGQEGDPSPKPDTEIAAQTSDPGVVDIRVSSGAARSFGGGGADSGSSVGAGGVQALMRTAIDKYRFGSYSGAASLFEEAQRGGGDPISTNQWLARCYGYMNRKSDQVEAYKRCAAACEAALAKGGGNRDRVNATLDTCRQELKVLQGN